MASLFKDARSSIYVVEFYDPRRTPAKRRVSTAVRDQRAADRLRKLWEVEYASSRYDPWTDPPPVPGIVRPARPSGCSSLANARSSFLESRSHRTFNTRSNYERVTGWFVAHAGPDRLVSGINGESIERWLETLDVKPVTQANYVRHLRAFLRFCVAEGFTARDVTADVRLARAPRHFPKALRPEQVETVAAYAEAHCRDGVQRSSAWVAPFIRLGAETAMRRGELLALRWDHVDLAHGHLTVVCTEAFTTKSGAERRIPLSARAVAVLTRLRERPSMTGHVVEAAGRVVAPHTCSDTVAKFAERAGVPALTPHVLRHSCITWLIERGVPVPVVQRFAGHADITTTMRYCSVATDVYADQIRSALG